MKNKKMIISISSMVVILILLLGASYALFAYEGIGTNKSQLIMGDIYMHYKEKNQLMISDNDVNNANILPDIKTIDRYKVNPTMASEEVNKLSSCVSLLTQLGISDALDEGSTVMTVCQGTGTFDGGLTLQQFWDEFNAEEGFMEDIGNHLINDNIMILENGVYVVNPIMATQEETDGTKVLHACMQFIDDLGWAYDIDPGSTLASYCQGTGTIWGGATIIDNVYWHDFSDEDIEELISQSIIVEESIPYTDIVVKQEFANQKTEYANSLTACVNLFQDGWYFDEGSTAETFCQGTGTQWDNTFQDLLDDWMIYEKFAFEYMTTNNIIIPDGDSYVVNPDMANQTVGEINELMSCAAMYSSYGYEFDEGSTAETFCQGVGTSNGSKIQEDFEYRYNNDEYFIFEVGRYILDYNAFEFQIKDVPYFEFTISGKNTYSQANIYYEILLDYGDPHETRSERIRDDLLRFSLIKIVDGNETIVFENSTFNNIKDKMIYLEKIPKNTMEEINVTYRLYVGFYEGIKVGEVGPNSEKTVDYDFNTWNNEIFASVKVNVRGELRDVPLSTQVRNVLENKPDTTVTDETGTIYISGSNESGLHNTFTYGTEEIDVPEKYKVDYNYVWYSGKLWRIICVYSDGTMKLVTDNPVTSIEFGEDNNFENSRIKEWLNQEFLPTLYNYENIIVTDSLWNITEKINFDGTMIPETTMVENPIGLLNIYEVYKTQETLENSPAEEELWNPNELSYISGGRNDSWTLTPYTRDWSGDIDYFVWNKCFWEDYDGPEKSSSAITSGVRPAINLQSTVRFSGGTGTRNNPYTIEGDIESAGTNTLINERLSGEYVKLENDDTNQLFRIIDIETINNNLTTKLILDNYIKDVDNLNKPNFTESENLYLQFTNVSGNFLWTDVDKTNTNLWRGYLNNIWLKRIDNTYNEETGESEILEKGKYYLGIYDTYYNREIGEYQGNYKTTVCNELIDGQSVRQCIENGNVVSNIAEDDYVGLPRVGEIFATKAGKDYQLTPDEKWLLTLQFLISPTPTGETFTVIDDYGAITHEPINYVHWARPTINLKSNLVIKSGNGTLSSPFVVGLPD